MTCQSNEVLTVIVHQLISMMEEQGKAFNKATSPYNTSICALAVMRSRLGA